LSTAPLIRNADLALAAAALATTGTDAMVDHVWAGVVHDAGGKGRTVRAIKLVAFDTPVVLFAVGLNHEFGHVTRAGERGYRSDLDINGTPWSGDPFTLFALDPEIFDDMGSQVGGEEASKTLKERGERAMRGESRIAAGHALTVILASLDLPLYAYGNLAPDQTQFGDLTRFVSLVARQRGRLDPVSLDRVRGSVRARSMLNLLDVSLWGLAYGVAHDHVWRGDAGVRVPWLRVGSARFIPAMQYSVTPIGPEYAARTHIRSGRWSGSGYVRWSERVGSDRQIGVGGSIAGWVVRGMRPNLAADVWSHSAAGGGLHGALGIDFADRPSRRATLTMAVGAKSSGYLSGFATAGGAYVLAGLNVRPW
jgi:hypothetical protein